mmetsp:Transcript_17088/g.43021  ORF Transcript_17088/g.43021 Transcript_17088/m.43021 type:complete len:228 (-) Transcript_17088:436-1119(-)
MAESECHLPSLHDFRVLPRGPIPRTRHIAHDAREPIVPQPWHRLRGVARHDEGGGPVAEATCPPRQGVTPQRRRVVRHDKPIVTQLLKHLRRLRARRGAHVEHDRVCRHIKQHRRQHARHLLPHEHSALRAANEPAMQRRLLTPALCRSQLVLVQVELPSVHHSQLARARVAPCPGGEQLIAFGAEGGTHVSREAKGDGQGLVQRRHEVFPLPPLHDSLQLVVQLEH